MLGDQSDRTYRVRPVGASNWTDLERLFEACGGPSYCWCMAWRATGDEQKHTDPASRKGFLKQRVDAGIPIGILAYNQDEPVAWCSIAPKETYRRLDNLKRDEPGERIWSIACFFISRAHRKCGLNRFLIQAAIDHAARCGATIIEAYPVDPNSPSYRFMGFLSTFQSIGFEEIGLAGSRRHVIRRRVAWPNPSPNAGARPENALPVPSHEAGE